MKALFRILPIVSAALCCALLVLLLVDAVMGDRSFIFNNRAVKLLVLLTGLCAALCACRLIARDRRQGRR